MRTSSFAPALASLLLTVVPLTAQTDGQLDLTFGFGDGIAAWGAPSGDAREIAGIAPHEERLYVYGHLEFGSGPVDHFAFMGVAEDGSLTNYGCDSAGTTIFNIPFDSVVASRAEAGRIDSSGHLLIGGWLRLASTPEVNRPFVARFRTDALGCALDLSYSDSGWEFFDDETWCDDEDCSIEELVEIAPATGAVAVPRTVALVRSAAGMLSARYFLLGLTAAGDIDTGFGTDGWVEVAADLAPLAPGASLAVDPRGWLWVQLSYYASTLPADVDGLVQRHTAGGSFGTRIMVATDPLFDEFAGDLVIAHDRDPIASYTRNSTEKSIWTRDHQSAATFEEHFILMDTQFRLAAQGDGRVVAACNRVVVMRLHGAVEGQVPLDLDSGFGEFGGIGLFEVDFGDPTSVTVTDVALWHGRPVIAGHALNSSSTTTGFIARLSNAYIFADGFEGFSAAAWADAVP